MNSDEHNCAEHDRAIADIFGERLRRGREQHVRWLDKTAEGLSRTYKIEVAAHRKLLQRLGSLEAVVLSGSNLSKENWKIPRDLRPWKQSRAELKELANSLEAASKIADNILDEGKTAFWALNKASESLPYGLPDLSAIRQLAEIAAFAAAMKGKSGNRPHPQWMLDATEICLAFWRKHKRVEPTCYFNVTKKPRKGEFGGNKTTSAGNEFSRWFCDVMNAVGGLNISQCATLLGRVRLLHAGSGAT